MPGLIRLFLIIAISLMLHACGGGSAETPWDSTTDGTTTGGTDGGTTTDYFLGSGAGSSFVQGSLNIGVTSLSAGGSTSVSANIADASGNLYLESASVGFTSTCVASGLASITSPITTTDGAVTTTYNAAGCSGSDTITATTTVNGSTRTATGSLTVQPAVIGSLEFVSAIPTDIGIRGFGLVEVSRVTFRVLDTNGNPVANELVGFSLNTSVGGITLSDTSVTSDNSGLVQVDVQSGTISTVVRVTARLVSNPSVQSQSDGLVISTGIADQNSMSLAVSDKNPEAWSINGQTVDVTVHAADHFNNPVPDGTAVSFTTEGGQIQPQCLTVSGSCSVTWTSANPRPANGRATILATMIGEESFVDTNGNGVLDNADTFSDMPEAFRDDNESANPGVDPTDLLVDFDLGSEEFLDFNSSGGYDLADGEFNGVLCCDATAVGAAVSGEACFGVTPTSIVCSTRKNIHVRQDNYIVMASSDLVIVADVTSMNGAGETVDNAYIQVYGVHNGSTQVPPSGTTIRVSSTNGRLESAGSITVPSTNGVTNPATVESVYGFNVRWRGDTTPSSGSLSITATTPGGLISDTLFIDLTD